MKITALESRRYRLPLAPPFEAAWDPLPRDHFDESIVIVHTDTGLRGYAGGAATPDLGLLETLLVGCDAADSEQIFDVCQSVDFHGGRNWTVEVALQDVVARSLDMPLCELLESSRMSFPAYASTGERLGAEARVERTLQWREQGIRAIKLRLLHRDWREDLAIVEAVRDAVGDTVEILVDANHGWRMPGDRSPRWDLATAAECARALADLDVFWLEEPLDPALVDDYVRLRRLTDLPIAGGEMVRSLAETQRLIGAGAFDVVQNDVVLAGGVEGTRRVAQWAKQSQVRWSPHTWSTGYGLLANLHVALALSTARFIEVPYDPPGWSPARRDFMLPEPLEIAGDGTITPPAGPGLGIEPDFDALERWRVG